MTPWLTAAEAAHYLRLSVVHVRKLAREGRLRHHRPFGSKKLMFRREDLDEYMEA